MSDDIIDEVVNRLAALEGRIGIGHNGGPPLDTKIAALEARIGRNSAPLDSQVLTFPEWCRLGGFSLRTGRRILNSGKGPVVTRLSARRIGVTIGNDRIWKSSRER